MKRCSNECKIECMMVRKDFTVKKTQVDWAKRVGGHSPERGKTWTKALILEVALLMGHPKEGR